VRSISRLVATTGLLLLGGAAFSSLPLEYLPRQSFPELTVALTLPEAREPAGVTRDWVEEIEGAIRSLGRVRGTTGEVRSDGATLTVRFTPGTDPERKAARLESELAGLRRRLPHGARLAIDPAAQAEGNLLALVWLSGVRSDADAEAAAEELRGVPGVRDVEALGVRSEEVRVELAPGTLDPSGTAAAVSTEIDRAVRRPQLGATVQGDRRLPVIVPQTPPEALRYLPVPLGGGGSAPLGTVAAVRTRWPEPLFRVRYHGQPARALFVWRAEGAPLLATDQSLRQRVAALPRGVHGTVDWSEAAPLRDLLGRLALGGLLAALSAAFLGHRMAGRWGALSLGLALPAGVAAGANALWLAGMPLNVTTLVAFALGATAALPAAALRLRGGGPHPRPSPSSPHPIPGRGEKSLETLAGGAAGTARFWMLAVTMAAAAAALPIAVGLAGDELGPLLSSPARAFLLVAASAVLAAALLPAGGGGSAERRPHPRPLSHLPPTPPPGEGRRVQGKAGSSLLLFFSRFSPLSRGRVGGAGRGAGGEGRLQRHALRDPGTTALTLFTACAVVATLFGPALVPRPGDLSPDGGSFDINLRLPDGATLAETERQVRAVEEQLAKAEEVERYWSSSHAGHALVRVEVRPRDRHPDRLERLATRIRYQIAGAAARIETGAEAAGGGSFVLDFEERAKADDEGQLYRIVLRSGDLGALRVAYRRILDRLDALKVRPYWITGWGDPSVLLTLQPVKGTAPREIGELASALSRKSAAPVALSLPPGPGGAERALVVVPAGSPDDPDRAVPAVAGLLGNPLRLGDRVVAPASAFSLRRDLVYPRIARQSGRFVLPVEVRLPLSGEEARLTLRRNVDRNLAQLRLPAGVDLERPALSLRLWQPDRLRVAALALAVPLLLFAVAAWRLGSPLRALVALVPLAAGLLAATPLVQATLGQVDELTVFALAASLCLTLPLAIETAGSGRADGRETGADLYRGLRRDAPWLAASLIPAVLSLAVPTLGVDLIRFRWVVPLRAAALTGFVSLLAATVAVPALRLAAVRWRQRDPEDVRRRRRPPAWSAPGLPSLTVRSLTKTYRSGHTALSGVSFELTPGITGLLGPNGAGKTTLLRILTGLLAPTRGSVSFRGVPVTPEDLAEYRVRIGFLPQEFNAYPDFTAEQFLEHWALERGMDDVAARRAEIDRLLAAVGLAEHARRKVRDYSGGMRQRIGIARALLGAPPILVVDEPTTGLDIEARGRFRQTLLEQAADRIVLFSTHIASDVEAAASRILLLHRGHLHFDGTPEELIARAHGRVFAALVTDAEIAAFGHRYRVTARVRRLEGLQVRAVARPGDTLAGTQVEPNLEEAYLAEIERVDAAEGRERREETFSFLDRGAA